MARSRLWSRLRALEKRRASGRDGGPIAFGFAGELARGELAQDGAFAFHLDNAGQMSAEAALYAATLNGDPNGA